MSIQSAINQAIGTAAIGQKLYMDSPGYKLNQAQKHFNARKQTISDIVNSRYKDVTGNTAPAQGIEITEHPELFEGQAGKEFSKALDLADQKYVADAAVIADLKPNKENINQLAHRQSQSELRHQQREEMLNPTPATPSVLDLDTSQQNFLRAKQSMLNAQAQKRLSKGGTL